MQDGWIPEKGGVDLCNWNHQVRDLAPTGGVAQLSIQDTSRCAWFNLKGDMYVRSKFLREWMGGRSGETDRTEWRGEEKALWRGYQAESVKTWICDPFRAWSEGASADYFGATVLYSGPVRTRNDVQDRLSSFSPHLGPRRRTRTRRVWHRWTGKRDGAAEDKNQYGFMIGGASAGGDQ
jgi:hypothetical protein